MLQVLNATEIEEHEKRMAQLRDAMPDEVWLALGKVVSWCDEPDTWDETVERLEGARWWLQRRTDVAHKRVRPIEDMQEKE